MKRVALTAHRRQGLAVALVVALVAGALVFVTRSDTYRATKFELNDSGIWGTRTSDATDPVGRLNTAIQSVDMAPPVDPSKFVDPDVVQSGANVVIFSANRTTLAQVAVAQASVQPPQAMPPGSFVGMGGNTGAVFAPATGALWVGAASMLGTQTYVGTSATKPTVRIGHQSAVAVGTDGTTYAYDPGSGLLSVIAHGRVATKQLEKIVGDTPPQITVVGDHAVVLDSTGHRLFTSDGKDFTLPDDMSDEPQLQQPGDNADGVLIASSHTLATVALNDGTVGRLFTTVATNGTPVPPVALGGCVYGAWTTRGLWKQICGKVVNGDELDPNGTAPLDRLAWRVNRGRVALNDGLNGTWETFDPLARLGAASWLTAFGLAPKGTSGSPNSGPSANPQCKTSRGPSTAAIDAGVRPGASVVIPVVQHDVDPSGCHVLAIIDAHTDVSGSGTVAIVDEGRSLLFTPIGNQDSVLVNYTVSDGAREATGIVTVHVYGPSVETPPVLNLDAAKVQVGHAVTFNVLANDTDHEGDPVRLLEAHIVGAATTAQPVVRSDGAVTVPAAPQYRSGQKIRVLYGATDDRPGGVSRSGILEVTVQSGIVAPIAAPDFGGTSLNARTSTGTRELAVDLLANDSVGSGTSLTLVSVSAIPGQRFRFVGSGQLFFTPTIVGDFSTTYIVSDGTSTVRGRLRIRVTKGGPNHPPVAVPDIAQLRSDGNATVSVLNNDTDADADVLFVNAVSLDPDVAAMLRVAIIDHAQLRITATTHVTVSLNFEYTVTDGVDSSQGIITVLPPTSVNDNEPPVARDDQATVRAKGAAEIPVLANDFDPNNGTLALDPKTPFTTLSGLTRLDPAKQGLLYVHGTSLRFAAPSVPGTVRVNYNVTNGYATSTAQLTINVIADDQANQGPQPPPLVARVFAGSSAPLTIPLLGVDPENDPVSVVGLGTPPSRGVVEALNGARLTYRADRAEQNHGGTDLFTYWLRDDHGSLGEGSVLIAVVPPPLLNTAPVPEDDAVRARPGTTIRIPVTANDVDADGDPISVADAPDGPTKPSNASQPRVIGTGTLEVSVPPLADGTQVVFFYGVTDGINPTSSQRGQVIVTVDRHAVDLPVAVDDVVPGTRAPDPAATATVTVRVLANDTDPSYDSKQLTILPSFNKSYRVAGGDIVMPVGTKSRLVSYCIENPEKSTSCAFVQITVGDPKSAPPIAVTDLASVGIGHSVQRDVTANDQRAPGRSLRVTTILGSHWGSAKVTGGRVITFTPYPTAPGYGEVVYQVSDGSQSAEGIFFITVTGNQPPTLEGSAVAVAPGDHVVVPLASHVIESDPANAGRYKFQELSRQVPAGISVDVSANSLTISASASSIGQTGSIVLRASNGRLWSRAAMFQITVTRPPAPQATNFTAGPFKQGSPAHVIDVLAHVTDPVGKGLHIVKATVAGAAGAVAFDQSVGGSLRYTPSAQFSGQTQILVTVGDSTGQASRQTVASIVVAVYGPPTAPTVTPSVTARTDTSTNTAYFALDWTGGPARPNGASIDHYEVNFSGGDHVDKTCAGSGPRCGFSGLTFGKPYVFKVRAVDVYGDQGSWGPSSHSQQYDVAPPAVLGASADFDVASSTTIDLSWAPPSSKHFGSAITFYDVYLGDIRALSVAAPATTAKIGGLVTGQAYQLTVKTRNVSGQQSDGVTTSPPVRPLGSPTSVPSPSVSESLNVSDSVDVSWTPPSSPSDVAETGGDDPANLHYFVMVDGVASPASGPGLYNFSNPIEGHAYQIKLGVANSLTVKTCASQLSACARYLSNTVSFTTYGPPLEVGSPLATPSASQQISLTFTPGGLAPGSPADLQSLVFLTNVSPPVSGVDLSQPLQISSGWSTPANLAAGQSYTFTLQSCAVPSNTPGRKFCETDPQTASATPYGPPGTPSTPSGSVNGRTITWDWSAPGNDGCSGCGINHYVLSGFGNVATSQQAVNYGSYSTRYCVTAYAVNNKGVRGGDSGTGCATTGPPPGTVTVTEGGAKIVPGCMTSACHWVVVSVAGLSPPYNVDCHDDIPDNGATFYSYSTSSATSQVCVYGVVGGHAWVVVNGRESNHFLWHG